ncbi:hypothetical protein EM864_01010 [Stenotrophomonas acidaminiphila]|nr:hypothetical protein [Stenotrophomonas acidaminiphila]
MPAGWWMPPGHRRAGGASMPRPRVSVAWRPSIPRRGAVRSPAPAGRAWPWPSGRGCRRVGRIGCLGTVWRALPGELFVLLLLLGQLALALFV